MNTLLRYFENSNIWSLYCIDSNTHIYAQSAYNDKHSRRCMLYAMIKLDADNADKLESITLEESWEEINDIKHFVLAVLYVECDITTIDRIIVEYLNI